jgi:hypothetical protein
MGQDVIYKDGSVSTFHEGGGSFHEGTGITRLRLISARSALSIYLKYEGRMQVTRNGHRMAVINVIEPLSGKTFSTPSGKVTMKSCREALVECERMLAEIEDNAVVCEVEG